MNKKSKRLYFDESVWEDYVAKHPETFLNEDLKLFKRQWQLPSECGRPDLVFERKNGKLLLVELQLKALDRNHFYKTFEYQREIQTITGKATTIKILCNSLNQRKNYVEMHSQNIGVDIDVIFIPEKEVKRRIIELDAEVVFVSSKSKIDKTNRSKPEHKSSLQEINLQNRVNELESALKVEKQAHIPNELLSLIYRKEEYKDALRWKRELFQIVETMAEPYHHKTWYGHEVRAFCPLCNRGADDIYDGEIGWKIPLGLERHILNTHGAHPCKISANAMELVRPYFSEKFKIVEDTYLTNPNESPKLIDKGLLGFNPLLRSAEQMRTAEKRLKELNFFKNESDGVIKYTQQIDNYTVFADPRGQGRIDFLLFEHKTLKRGTSYKQVGNSQDFYILDNWKNIEVIFNKRIAKLIV